MFMNQLSPNNRQTIECPNCSTEIEISEVLSSQLEKDLRKSLERETAEQMKTAVKKAQQEAHKKSALDLKDLENQLAEREKESLDLRKKTRELHAKQEGLEDEIAARVKQGQAVLQEKLSADIKASLTKENEATLLDLKTQVEEKNKAIQQSRDLELNLRKQARDLEEKQKEVEITLQRRLDEGRKEIADSLAEKYDAESNLKLKEKEKQIESL